VEVVFGPILGNDPMAIYGGVPHDPALFDENWSLIRDVRERAKENGPPSRFDLLNEGAPSDAQVLKPQIIDYVARLYRAYVDAFGNEDVSVSTIYQQVDPTRLPNLLAALRASGRPMPAYFEVHADYTASLAIQDLKDMDAGLAAAGLNQPLVVGEAPYDDDLMAAAVKAFVHQSARAVTDVLEWPLERDSGCRDFSVAPPYRATAYVARLKGASAVAATAALSGSVSAAGGASLTNGSGLPVTALEDGVYRLRVDDRSARAGFGLAGPRVARRTSALFAAGSSGRSRYGPACTDTDRARVDVTPSRCSDRADLSSESPTPSEAGDRKIDAEERGEAPAEETDVGRQPEGEAQDADEDDCRDERTRRIQHLLLLSANEVGRTLEPLAARVLCREEEPRLCRTADLSDVAPLPSG